MIRQDDNFVAVVPIDRALQNQPELVDSINNVVQVGDTIVTRVFNIKYVSISDVTNLLQNMKLSVAVTSLENNNLLLVTCHSDRMNRVERLVNMIDQPGRSVECQFRRLYYTLAPALIEKIRTMARELEGISINVPSSSSDTPKPVTPVLTSPPVVSANEKKKSVYLDIDERTNRIIMIGFEEDLSLIEKVIDILDVAQADPRPAGRYNLKYISASDALDKLQKLDIIRNSSSITSEPAARRPKQRFY